MKRSSPLRRSQLKRRKPSYPPAALERERAAWGAEHFECWICGERFGLQTHEIASRAQAPLRWADVRNYFRACEFCNSGFLNWAPEALMLAYKRVYDPDNYDREFVNELRHRATDAISEEEVRCWRIVLTRNAA